MLTICLGFQRETKIGGNTRDRVTDVNQVCVESPKGEGEPQVQIDLYQCATLNSSSFVIVAVQTR